MPQETAFGLVKDKKEFIENKAGKIVSRQWFYVDEEVEDVSEIEAKIQELTSLKTQLQQFSAEKKSALGNNISQKGL